MAAECLRREQNPVQKREATPNAARPDDARSSRKAFTTSMTDECFRSKRSSRVADQMVYLLNQLGIPRYLDPIKRFQLAAFQILGKPFAFLFVPMATFMLRKETSTVILPGEKKALSQTYAPPQSEGVRLNLNHLGEPF